MTSTFDVYVTKDDLEQSLEEFYIRVEKMVVSTVSEIVSEIVGDALQLIDARFDRLEKKVDKIAATVDQHTIDIYELQRKTA